MAKKIPQRHQNAPRPKLNIKIKKEDVVKVIAGKDKGKTGRVLEVNRETGRVLVEGVNLVKRHTRPNPQRQIQGGIAESERTIHVSNVMLTTSNGQVTRLGTKVEGGQRVRVARKTGEVIETKAKK
ncbi:MAG: ribosomal protein [Acidobacteriota bacterium]|jgi:large subunit ribosomal protein L24